MSKTGLTIKLIGEDGNAFSILARARRLLKSNGMSHLLDEYSLEATSGDYDHLLAVTMNWFDVEDTTDEELSEMFQKFEEFVGDYLKPILDYEEENK